MSKYDLTLTKIRRAKEESSFSDTYSKFLLGNQLTNDEIFYLLKTAILFINSDEQIIERLGYRIILHYSNSYKDYKPLYDLSVLNDFVPVSKFIERKFFSADKVLHGFSSTLLSAYQENFKNNINDGYYRSLGQLQLYSFAKNTDNVAIVAPTSYGKSEMMRTKIRDHLDQKVCIIVPSKALLAQTKSLLVQDQIIREGFEKVVTHPEMYRGEQNFLAVFTQERLLKFIQDNKELSLDLVMIDEAHNILEKDHRAVLLVQVLLMLKARNQNMVVNYFTPFLADTSNLRVVNKDFGVRGKKTLENMKVEMFYGYDFRSAEGLFLYDQFMDKKILMNVQYEDEFELIEHKAGRKNILYLNRPKHAEEVALMLSQRLENIRLTNRLRKVIESISELVHPNYNLITALRKGVLYHHGAVPDIVRLYIEDVFEKTESLRYMVTTSTLLEGINIPAEKMFILSPEKTPGYLTSAQFKNLIGRVCRFREVFNSSTGSLSGLEPEIYTCGIERYSRDTFTPFSFYNERANVSKEISDKVTNPLLENSVNTETRQETLEYMENMQPGSSGLEDVAGPETDLGRMCYEHNVYDFSIIQNETIINENLESYRENNDSVIDNAESLMGAIYQVFINRVELSDDSDNIARLRDHQQARNFYRMFIDWRSRGTVYSVMINNFINHWNNIQDDVYIGKTWGEKKRGGGFRNLYVDMTQKSNEQKINLAIAKIKEEQDFVDFHIMKYVEVLNALELIDESFYDRVKYGTTNERIICLLKNGFSLDLARRLVENYGELIEFNLERDTLSYNEALVEAMRENNENEILIFEARHNLIM